MLQRVKNLDVRSLRLFQSINDLEYALTAFNLFAEVDSTGKYPRSELRRFRCFLDAGVLAYGRPFTRTKGVPPLSFKRIGLNPTPEQAALHQSLLRYRDRVVAHPDADHMQMPVMAFSALEDRPDLKLPVMASDESLPSVDRRDENIAWLRVLVSKLAKKGSAVAQKAQGSQIQGDSLARATGS